VKLRIIGLAGRYTPVARIVLRPASQQPPDQHAQPLFAELAAHNRRAEAAQAL